MTSEKKQRERASNQHRGTNATITTPRQRRHHKNEMEAHDQKELKIAQNREEETNRQVAHNRLNLLILYGPIQSTFDALLYSS